MICLQLHGKPTVDNAKISMSTPGGTRDREFTAEFNLNRPEKSVSAYFKCPWRKVDMSGKFRSLNTC